MFVCNVRRCTIHLGVGSAAPARRVIQRSQLIQTTAKMVDSQDFIAMNAAMQAYDQQREKVIKETRDIQKLSKHSIYSLHRADFAEAEKKLTRAKHLAEGLLPMIAAEPTLRYGSYANCMEEYAEGYIFMIFLQEGRIPRAAEMPMCERDEYLGGVLDFTGELNRYAIQRATVRDVAAVKCCRDIADSLMGIFLQFDFRNGALRKKFDALKYTLRKMETTLYEMALTENLGFKRAREEDDGEDARDAAE